MSPYERHPPVSVRELAAGEAKAATCCAYVRVSLWFSKSCLMAVAKLITSSNVMPDVHSY